MKLFKGVKRKLSEYQLKQRAKKSKREVQFPGLKHCKHALITGYIKSKADLDGFMQFRERLVNEGVQVDGLLGYDETIPETQRRIQIEHCLIITPTDLEKVPLPEDMAYKRLVQKEYDLLADLSTEDFYPIKYCCSLSKSLFKIGASEGFREEHFDVVIDVGTNQSTAYLAEQLLHYIKMINP